MRGVTALKVKDLIKRRPLVVHRESTILEAARTMVKENVGLLVVVDDRGDVPLGVVSERDIIRAYAENRSADTRVWAVASKNLIMVGLDEDVGAAATKMVNNRVRHLVVIDRDGKLRGVLSIRDLVAERSTLNAIASSYEYEPFAGGD
jgi:CBS domain-containing protein